MSSIQAFVETSHSNTDMFTTKCASGSAILQGGHYSLASGCFEAAVGLGGYDHIAFVLKLFIFTST